MNNIKSFFPVFRHHPQLIFLDSAASVQKPQYILNSIQAFAEKNYANIHRGNYPLSLEATEYFENARKDIQSFLGAEDGHLICTKNGTEASNIFANACRENFLTKDDEIIIPISEHHANIVPWMNACKKTGAKIIWIFPERNTHTFTPEDFINKITNKTKIVTFAHVANVTGQIFPVQEITQGIKKKQEAYSHEILICLDACQSVPHLPFQFEHLGIHAAFFTGHKLGAGATGGLLLSKNTKKFFKENLSPLLFGGNMIRDVKESGFSLLDFPHYFEAGTPNIEHIMGLQKSTEFLSSSQFCGGMEKIQAHETEILEYTFSLFRKKLPHWKIVGPQNTDQRIGNISFYHPHIHHSDIGAYLGEKNIAVRTGFHCANPLHHWLKISGTVRASFWVYTEKHEIETLATTLQEIEDILG